MERLTLHLIEKDRELKLSAEEMKKMRADFNHKAALDNKPFQLLEDSLKNKNQ